MFSFEIVFEVDPDYNNTIDNGAVPETFTITVTDGNLQAQEEIEVTVTAVNDAPVSLANDPSYEMNEDDTLDIDLTLTTTDVDNDTATELTYELMSAPTDGTLTNDLNSPSWQYEPDADFVGDDSFTYRANDGEFNSETVTISITVTNLNDTPIFTSIDNLEFNEDEEVDATRTLTVTATDPDATDTLTFDTEKLLLDDEDSIIGICTTGTVSATASYTDV